MFMHIALEKQTTAKTKMNRYILRLFNNAISTDFILYNVE